MHPMTFYEYLLAMGKELMAEHILKQPDTVAESIQQMILNELRSYFIGHERPVVVMPKWTTWLFVKERFIP